MTAKFIFPDCRIEADLPGIRPKDHLIILRVVLNLILGE
jgi:hypothetical protein